MVLLPTPLKAFTDTMPEVKAMLRVCARNFYGWHCDHQSIAEAISAIDAWGDWSAYPASWPRKPGGALTLGVMPINDGIRSAAGARLKRIRRDLEHRPPLPQGRSAEGPRLLADRDLRPGYQETSRSGPQCRRGIERRQGLPRFWKRMSLGGDLVCR